MLSTINGKERGRLYNSNASVKESMNGLSSITITNDGSYGYFTIIAIFKGSWLLFSPAMSYLHFLPLTYFPSSASYVPEDKITTKQN